eukprot:363272-Chlamydomonas_euryale.AAC.9
MPELLVGCTCVTILSPKRQPPVQVARSGLAAAVPSLLVSHACSPKVHALHALIHVKLSTVTLPASVVGVCSPFAPPPPRLNPYPAFPSPPPQSQELDSALGSGCHSINCVLQGVNGQTRVLTGCFFPPASCKLASFHTGIPNWVRSPSL